MLCDLPYQQITFFEWPPRADLYSDMHFYFHILSGILSNMLSGILSGVCSDILSGILLGMCSGPWVPSDLEQPDLELAIGR